MAERTAYCCRKGNLCGLVQASVNDRGGVLPVASQLTKQYVDNNQNLKIEKLQGVDFNFL